MDRDNLANLWNRGHRERRPAVEAELRPIRIVHAAIWTIMVSLNWQSRHVGRPKMPKGTVPCDAQKNVAGVFVAAAVPNVSGNSITIYLNKAVTTTYPVGWMVIEHPSQSRRSTCAPWARTRRSSAPGSTFEAEPSADLTALLNAGLVVERPGLGQGAVYLGHQES